MIYTGLCAAPNLLSELHSALQGWFGSEGFHAVPYLPEVILPLRARGPLEAGYMHFV